MTIVLSWSGGKDSALALERLRDAGQDPACLLATLDEDSGRATHHGTPRELIAAQARAAGLPLVEIAVPRDAGQESYGELMRAAFARAPLAGASAVAFGDLYLEQLRAFREQRLASIGVEALFPLWGADTAELARSLPARGYEALVVSVDPAALDRSWLGRSLDAAFFAELPAPVDPCGERGEFHTFVSDCPAFASAVPVRPGEPAELNGFPFLRLELVASGTRDKPYEKERR